MVNLRKFIRIILEETLLKESAMSISQILSNPDIGLVVFRGSQLIEIVLFNFKNLSILGTLATKPVSSELQQTAGIATEPGCGPLIFELGLMALGKPLCLNRSGDIRDKALGVWEKFINRTDIEKIAISKDTSHYSNKFDSVDGGKSTIFNMALHKAPTPEFNKLVSRGFLLMEKYNVEPHAIKQQAGNFFVYRYTDS